MATLRLFASAREAAGRGRDSIPGSTVGEVLAAARARYGDDFSLVLPRCRIWLNGEAADEAARVGDDDEVAVLPPVSGG
jgi:molybdopterin converting factor small subunit